MKNILKCLLSALFLLASTPLFSAPVIFQYSTIDALLAGAFDGEMSVGDLGKKGNFGIGTYNRIDGEMVVVDGVFYQVKANGQIVVAGTDQKSPFAVLTDWIAPAERFHVANIGSLGELESYIDTKLDNKNAFFAVRIDGFLNEVSTRAIPPQDKPYPILAEAAKKQVIFKTQQKKGTLIGFRSPGFAKGFNVPGYHWHFLSEDRKSGGHVLTLAIREGTLQFNKLLHVEMAIPDSEGFAGTDQSRDRSQELHQVEKSGQ